MYSINDAARGRKDLSTPERLASALSQQRDSLSIPATPVDLRAARELNLAEEDGTAEPSTPGSTWGMGNSLFQQVGGP